MNATARHWPMQLHLQSHSLHTTTTTTGLGLAPAMCRINFRIMYPETLAHTLHWQCAQQCERTEKQFSLITVDDSMQKGISRHLRAKHFIYSSCVAVSLSLHFTVSQRLVRRLHLVCACNSESARLFVCASFVCANKIVAKQQLFIIYCLSPRKHSRTHSLASDKRSANRPREGEAIIIIIWVHFRLRHPISHQISPQWKTENRNAWLWRRQRHRQPQ